MNRKISPPPSDQLTESYLLWALLIDSDILEEFFSYWQLEWFYYYRELAEAVFELWIEGSDIDLLSLKKKLEDKKQLEKIWGISALVELTESVTHSSNWKTHAKTLEKLYKQRELLKIAYGLVTNAYKDNYEDLVEKAMSSITDVLSEWQAKATDVEDNISLVLEHIEKNKGTELRGYSWGNSFLDKFTWGIQKSKTYRIGAPSGVWKTNLIYNLVPALLEQWAKVLFVSLENSIESTYIKLLSSVQWINPNKIEGGESEANFDYIRKYKDQFILTDQLFDLWEIKREVIKNQPDVVILDYIGLVNMEGADEKSLYNRYADDVKKFVQKNKQLAWIDLSNLNKDDDEERIRQHRGYNGSAKLKNNTDVWIHLFYYKPFYDYKRTMLDEGGSDKIDSVREWFHWKQVVTFLISKNRLWPDDVEEDFLIDFNEGIKYKKVKDEVKERWKEGI